MTFGGVFLVFFSPILDVEMAVWWGPAPVDDPPAAGWAQPQPLARGGGAGLLGELPGPRAPGFSVPSPPQVAVPRLCRATRVCAEGDAVAGLSFQAALGVPGSRGWFLFPGVGGFQQAACDLSV